MSSATKRKHVTRGVVENFDLPKDDELIVQVPLVSRENRFLVHGY